MKIILMLLTFSFAAIGCQPKIDKNPEPAPTEIIADTIVAISDHGARNSLDYIGAYKGKLNCKTCPAGEVMLELSEEFNYILTRQLKGAKQEMKGTFSWNKAGNAVVLDNLKTEYNTFFVGENTLALIDSTGKRMENNVLGKLTDAEAARTDEPSAKSQIKLAGSKWAPTNLLGVAISKKTEGKSYFLNFDADGRFGASGGCNSMGGKYVVIGSGIAFSGVMSTRMACADMSVEQQLQQVFAEADAFKIAAETLHLTKKGKIVATFAAIK